MMVDAIEREVRKNKLEKDHAEREVAEIQ